MLTRSTLSRLFVVLAGAFALAATGFSSTPKAATSLLPPAFVNPCGPMTFGPVTDYAVGAQPQMIAVGDLDNDGDDDIVVPNYASENVTVYLATASGFQAAPGSPISVTGNPFVARIGEFTGDNNADVAIAAAHSIVIAPGNGDGTFGSSINTDISLAQTNAGGQLTGGLTFATADFNGDLNLDVVIIAPNAQKVSVWMGDGHGNFAFAQAFQPIGAPAFGLATGDLNSDGRPDFAVGDGFADGSPSGSNVYVFIQQAGGTFAAPVTYQAYKSVRSLAIADLNGDTYPELIAGDYYGHGYQAYGGDDLGRVSIFFGNGDGTFGAPIHPLTGADNPESLGVADFNGDGNVDIATSNNYQRNGSGQQVSILLGDGSGGFAAPVLFGGAVGNHPSALAAGDFDGNGLPGLAWLGDYLVQSPVIPLKVMMNLTECDSTPPTITPIVDGTLGGNDWYVTDVHVEWIVTDNESDISSTTGCSATSVTADIAGFLLTCEATSFGGTNSQSVFIKRDATPPTATAAAGPPANANGWRKTNVTITFTGTDALSGGVTCSPQAVVTTEGSGQSRTGYCYDAAGNQSAPAVVSNINIDKTSPAVTINIPVDGAVYNRNQVVLANYGCSDARSGIASCVGTVASGQAIDTSKKANNAKLTVTATDLAGNQTKTTVTYSVK